MQCINLMRFKDLIQFMRFIQFMQKNLVFLVINMHYTFLNALHENMLKTDQ
jgi:hypothetical protein